MSISQFRRWEGTQRLLRAGVKVQSGVVSGVWPLERHVSIYLLGASVWLCVWLGVVIHSGCMLPAAWSRESQQWEQSEDCEFSKMADSGTCQAGGCRNSMMLAESPESCCSVIFSIPPAPPPPLHPTAEGRLCPPEHLLVKKSLSETFQQTCPLLT